MARRPSVTIPITIQGKVTDLNTKAPISEAEVESYNDIRFVFNCGFFNFTIYMGRIGETLEQDIQYSPVTLTNFKISSVPYDLTRSGI